MAGRLRLDAEQREGVEALTRGIVNKILHAPLAHLRNETESEVGLGSLKLARSLFALDDEAAPGAEADAALHREMERSRLLDAGLAEPGASDSSHETDADGEEE